MPDVMITGVAEAGIAFDSGRSALQLQALAAVDAVAEAGIDLSAIDGVCSSRSGDLGPGDRPALEIADYLGIRPSYMDSSLAGGASPLLQIMHAAQAIEAGLCSKVLVTYGSVQGSTRSRATKGYSRPHDVSRGFEELAFLPMPIGAAAMAATRHMFEFGTTAEDLAAVAVSQRAWAELNPEALQRKPLTIADVVDSAYIASPLHRADICLVSDGAGAVVLERSGDGRRGVRIGGFGEAHSHSSLFGIGSLTTTVANQAAAPALAMADVTVDDVDLVQIYDAFSILPVVLLEDIGFCAKGEGGPFVSAGHTRPGGRLPMNTQGGGLAHCHPGVYGIFLVIEAVRQLRHQARGQQVEAQVALCHASGGGTFGGTQATLVLTGA